MNVLSIGGSDPSSGAGIQSDIKTFENHGVYGFTVITAITSQNTKEISAILPILPSVIKSQLKCTCVIRPSRLSVPHLLK